MRGRVAGDSRRNRGAHLQRYSRDAADTQAREGLGAEHRGRRTQLMPRGQGALEAPEK